MTSLSGRQRLLNAIAGDPIDRIPVAPFIHVNFVREFFNAHDIDCIEKTIEVYETFDLDMIHRNCTPAYDDLAIAGEYWKCAIEHHPLQGRDEDILYTIRTPEGELRQVIGVRWSCPWDCEVAPKEYLLKSERDFELLEKYQPPVGRIETEPIRRARALVGGKGLTAPWMQGIFNQLGMLRPLDEIALDPLLRPEFFDRVMSFLLKRNLAIARQFAAAGADLISAGINMASGKMFDAGFIGAYVRPYEKEFFETLLAEGIKVIAHNCGCARNLLPLYADMGITIYESLTPSPHGDTDLSRAVEILGPHLALMGGIDQIDLLRRGTPADIEQAIRRALDTVRGRCRFILGTTDYLHEGTPFENIRHLARFGRQYG